MKNPLTPFPAASIAAYSILRVVSEVQYCVVAGGGRGAGSCGSGSGSEAGRAASTGVGNWKNLYGAWMFAMSVRGKGEVCRLDRLGRLPLKLILTCAPLVLDLERFWLDVREEEDFDDDSAVDLRFGNGFVLECRDDVDVRGEISW